MAGTHIGYEEGCSMAAQVVAAFLGAEHCTSPALVAATHPWEWNSPPAVRDGVPDDVSSGGVRINIHILHEDAAVAGVDRLPAAG